MDFYCYVLLDPRKPGEYQYKSKFGSCSFSYEPFYVGKGKGSRCYNHVEIAIKYPESKSIKARKIRNIIKAGLSVEIVKTKKLYKEDKAFDIERDLISTIGRLNLNSGPLCNLTDGGEGSNGYVFTDEDRLKVSKGLEKFWNGMDPNKYDTRRSILSASIKLWWDSLPETQRSHRVLSNKKKYLAWWESLSCIEKRLHTKPAREWWSNLSPDEYDRFTAKLSHAGYTRHQAESLTDLEKRINNWRRSMSGRTAKQRAETKRRKLAAMTPAKEALRIDRIRQEYSNRSPASKLRHATKSQDALRRGMAKKIPEEMRLIIAKRHAWKSATFRIVSPDGAVFKGIGIKPFCETHNLDRRLINLVCNGKLAHYENWTGSYINLNI